MSKPSITTVRQGLNTTDGSTSQLLFKGDHFTQTGNQVTVVYPKGSRNPTITWSDTNAETFAVGSSTYILANLVASNPPGTGVGDPPAGQQDVSLTVTNSNGASDPDNITVELFAQ